MNAYQASYWEALARTSTLSQMLELFDTYATDHANTAPAAIKRLTIRGLEARYGSDAAGLWETTLSLSRSGHATAEEVAAILLAKLYVQDAAVAAEELKRLADSPNWEVREWAASALGDVTLSYFHQIQPPLREWSHHPSENVRRAVVLSAMYASRTEDMEMANRLLDLLTPLLKDATPYVRNNLGPFALGDGFARNWPDLLLRRLTEWSQDGDEQVHWNLAMVFSAKAGAGLAPRAPQLLGILSEDTRQMVQKAWKKACKRIQKEIPGWTWTAAKDNASAPSQLITTDPTP